MNAPVELIEALAARQWDRMTRTTTKYDALTEWDKRACRALVTPVLDDVLALQAESAATA